MNAKEFMDAGERQSPQFIDWSRKGFTVIEPLTFLHGKEWNDVALGFIHALRPSSLRVVKKGCVLNSCCWRVTVWLTEDNRINRIDQEVSVGLPENIRNGHELSVAAKKS